MLTVAYTTIQVRYTCGSVFLNLFSLFGYKENKDKREEIGSRSFYILEKEGCPTYQMVIEYDVRSLPDLKAAMSSIVFLVADPHNMIQIIKDFLGSYNIRYDTGCENQKWWIRPINFSSVCFEFVREEKK